MKTITKLFAAAAAVSMVPAAPAIAQEAPAVQVGMQVVDTSGAPVGTVTQIDSGVYIVQTDRHEAALDAASFTPHEGKLLFAMSQAELNASIDQAQADAAASVAVGKPVKSINGNAAGTIDEIGEDYVQIELPSGKMVRIPSDAIRGEADAAMVFYEVAELEAQGQMLDEPAEMASESAAETAAEAAEANAEAAEVNAEAAQANAEAAQANAEAAAALSEEDAD